MAAELVPRRTLRAFLRQYHRSGHYRARTLVRHPVARRRSRSLALTPALVAALPAAAMGPRIARRPARLATGAYAAAVALETVHAAHARAWRRQVGASRRDVALVPLAFAAMHLGFGAGMCRGLAEAWLARTASNETSTVPPNQA